MRGEVKYKARNLVAILYGIEDLKGKPDGNIRKTLLLQGWQIFCSQQRGGRSLCRGQPPGRSAV